MAHPSELSQAGRRVLVTGIDGFTGRYIAAELRATGFSVSGTSHVAEDRERGIYKVNLLDKPALSALVEDLRPEAVIHLAAISFVAHDDAEMIYRTNIVGTRNLLSALGRLSRSPRHVVLASSANVYGDGGSEPIAENRPPNPANDYAVSKLAMEHMARLWTERLPVTIVRPFNYTGVGQASQFLIPKIVDHYRRGDKEIELGNIDVVRDFSDVRDVARIYVQLLVQAPPGGIYNLCSGTGYSLQEVIDILTSISRYQIEVRVNPAFVRKNEIKRLVGDAGALREVLGDVEPRPFSDTLNWMYNA